MYRLTLDWTLTVHSNAGINATPILRMQSDAMTETRAAVSIRQLNSAATLFIKATEHMETPKNSESVSGIAEYLIKTNDKSDKRQTPGAQEWKGCSDRKIEYAASNPITRKTTLSATITQTCAICILIRNAINAG
jgi:hypothetical protein